MLNHARIMLLAVAFTSAGLAAAAAQDASPAAPATDTRCGGLLCDLGIVNVTSNSHPLDEGLPCGFICKALGGHPAPPPVQVQPVAAETVPAEPVKKMRHPKRKRIAKAKTAEPPTDAATKAN